MEPCHGPRRPGVLRLVWPGVVGPGTATVLPGAAASPPVTSLPRTREPRSHKQVGMPGRTAVGTRTDGREAGRGQGRSWASTEGKRTSGKAGKNGAAKDAWGRGRKPLVADVLAPGGHTGSVCCSDTLFFLVAAVPLAAVLLF